MSGKQKKTNTSASKKRAAVQRQQARKNVGKNSTIVFIFTALAIVGIFLGRWITAIGNGYYKAFVEPDETTISAVRNMRGLDWTEDEEAELLPLQQSWDLFCAARLCDEVTTVAEDGVELHGYLYNEQSSVTVVVIPRFYQNGTADFLPGSYLHELTGCNILLIDQRSQGGSDGQYFTWGIQEQNDLTAWLRWADTTLGKQTFILWGEATGANTALFAAANGILPDNVAFIVAESPYASLREMAEIYLWKWYSVPKSFLISIEAKLNGSGAGFRLDDLELADALKDGEGQVPVLFLVSAEDAYIKPEWTGSVADSYSGVNQTISGGTAHGTVYAAQTQEIQTQLARWWADYGN